MQRELGVQASNLMLKDIQLAVQAQKISDMEAEINALRARNIELQDGKAELREMLDKATAKRTRGTGSTNS